MALSDEQVPGYGAEVVFGFFDDLLVSGDGTAGFLAGYFDFVDGAAVLRTAVFAVPPSGSVPFERVRTGDPAAGQSPGVSYSEIQSFDIAPGRLVFCTRLTGPGVDPASDAMVYRKVDGEPAEVLFREGDVPNGAPPGYTLHDEFDASVLDDGTVWSFPTLRSPTASPSFERAILIGADTEPMRVVAMEGQPVPGLPAGLAYRQLIFTPSFAEGGLVAFYGLIDGPGIDQFNSTCIFADRGNGVEAILRRSDPVPGFSSEYVVTGVGNKPQINASASLAIEVSVSGPDVDSSNDTMIMIDRGTGAFEILVREGNVISGIPGGLVIKNPRLDGLNARGDVLFRAELDGPGVTNFNRRVIGIARAGEPPAVIARAGDAVPGIEPATPIVSFGEIKLSDDGSVLVSSGFQGNQPQRLSPAFFTTDPAGVESSIVIEDQPVSLFVDGPDYLVYRIGSVAQVGPVGQFVFECQLYDPNDLNAPPIGGVFRLTAASCLPDTNDDGELNPADFNAWIIAFNNQSPACDQNGDGLCTPADFNAWIINFNAGCP